MRDCEGIPRAQIIAELLACDAELFNFYGCSSQGWREALLNRAAVDEPSENDDTDVLMARDILSRIEERDR